jgi:hypothetical protein
LNSPEFKPFRDHYVITTLVVQESPEKKGLENPGGQKKLEELGGAKSGLPFFAILDPAGKKLADSNVMPGNQNIGCPATAEEIAAFEKLVKQTAPRMSQADRGKLAAYLKKVAPK